MIAQRFKGCKFDVVTIPGFELEKHHQKGEDKQEKLLYQYISEQWDGHPVPVKQIRHQLEITDTYWSRLVKKKNIKNLFAAKQIKTSRLKGKGKDLYLYCLTVSSPLQEP
ncbi:hypothetical protein QJ48_24770 [Paenibacillus sp. A3]|nr:hypothetical protein QJ48_24770 [Paenibacillus sp. A3]